MERYTKYIVAAVAAVIVAGCMEFLSVNHPEKASVNADVEASFNISIAVDSDLGDTRGTVLVGVLAPVAWNPKDNITVTYSSDDMPGGAVKNMPMRLATDADLDPDKKTWQTAMTEKLGTQGNFEPVQWVVFISETKHVWNPGDKFTGTVNVKFKTGSENIKTNLAYFIGNTQDAVNNDPKYYLLHKQPFETEGGSNETIDYTAPKICFVNPDAFTWEDIVAINYDHRIQIDGKNSPLFDADAVYMSARALYDGGKEVIVDEVSAKTLMKKIDNVWKIYIYPHEFFQIPAGNKIEKLYFKFVNADKSIVVKNPVNGQEFTVAENNI